MRALWGLLALLVSLAIPQVGGSTEADYREALRVEIERLAESGSMRVIGVDLAAGPALVDFYEQRGFAPAWSNFDKICDLLDAVRASSGEGLDPADYNVEEIARAVEILRSGTELTPRRRASLDILLSDSLIRLGYHLRLGRVDPQTLDPRWNLRRGDFGAEPMSVLQRAIDSPTVTDFFADYLDRGPIYTAMRDALAEYRAIASDGGWPAVPDGPTLRPGARSKRVPALAARLAVSGDLDAETAAIHGDLFDGDIVAGVRRFQERHGIDIDGVVGPGTLAALNVPVQVRVEQLRVNLERARWILNNLDDELVGVNVAGFRAFVMQEGEISWETKVQVGKVATQTPIFRDRMTYLVVNPDWTVPLSIATRDLLPRIKSDPGFLDKGGFELRDRSGTLVEPASVDWRTVSEDNFPFTLLQRPGPSNSLGRIKFMFPNEYAVYLHDTPSRYLFDRSERAFSAGCIRVEEPFELAEFLLESNGLDRAAIESLVASREMTTIPLKKTVPILILYWTAWADDDGTVYFHSDIYDRDSALLDALKAPFEPGLATAERWTTIAPARSREPASGQAGVAAVDEQKGAAVETLVGQDLADDDPVIAAIVDLPGPAIESRQHVREDRYRRVGDLEVDVFEARVIGSGKVV